MGIMNNEISLTTKGKPIEFKGFSTKRLNISSDEESVEMSNSNVSVGKMIVGDLVLTIFFKSHDEMVEFCEKYSVDYDYELDV